MIGNEGESGVDLLSLALRANAGASLLSDVRECVCDAVGGHPEDGISPDRAAEKIVALCLSAVGPLYAEIFSVLGSRS